jgi:hypothetical protein
MALARHRLSAIIAMALAAIGCGGRNARRDTRGATGVREHGHRPGRHGDLRSEGLWVGRLLLRLDEHLREYAYFVPRGPLRVPRRRRLPQERDLLRDAPRGRLRVRVHFTHPRMLVTRVLGCRRMPARRAVYIGGFRIVSACTPSVLWRLLTARRSAVAGSGASRGRRCVLRFASLHPRGEDGQ